MMRTFCGYSVGLSRVAQKKRRWSVLSERLTLPATSPIDFCSSALAWNWLLALHDLLVAVIEPRQKHRAQFFRDVPAAPFYGFNRDGAKVQEGVIQNWWRQGMMGSAKAHYDSIKAFSETDQTEDLKAITVPTLVFHDEDDQIVPIADTARKSIKLLRNGQIKTYPRFPHGILTVNADVLNLHQGLIVIRCEWPMPRSSQADENAGGASEPLLHDLHPAGRARETARTRSSMDRAYPADRATVHQRGPSIESPREREACRRWNVRNRCPYREADPTDGPINLLEE